MTNYPTSWRINARAGMTPPAPPQGRRWYRISNTTGTTAEVLVYDEIGYYGITAQAFVADLEKVTAKQINCRLNSPGGDVHDGLAIYQALRRHPAKVTTHIDGVAASIASVIAMAGDRRIVARNASLMVHEASALCLGQAKDMQDMADLLDRVSANIADVYAHRTGRGTVDTWRAAMKKETWYTGREAVEAGLATEMTDDDPEDSWAAATAHLAGGFGEAKDWARTTARLLSTARRAQSSPQQPLTLNWVQK